MVEKLKKCEELNAPCETIGGFPSKIQEVKKFVNGLDSHLKKLPKSISVAIIKIASPFLVWENLSIPVNKCLENQL